MSSQIAILLDSFNDFNDIILTLNRCILNIYRTHNKIIKWKMCYFCFSTYRLYVFSLFFRKMMELGSSENWRDTLSLAIGENRLDGSALREFFQPLEEWLRNENLRTGQFIGWTYGMWF